MCKILQNLKSYLKIFSVIIKMKNLNIVQLFEKNPLTRLNKTYESKLINKIKNNFSDSQQQLFVGSFYFYLNYNNKTDFVVDFDSVWKWAGFSRKDHAKRLLEKNFIFEIDYKEQKADAEVGVKKNRRKYFPASGGK